ncbi:MAG TPA: MFS transporter [Gaiellaceae bacterium]|jgi:MFS family permease|nr:MFS transporter [Gaiellaceae bacterium]
MAERRPTLREGIRSLPAPVWILCAGTFVNRFGSFVAVFLVLYLRSRGYSIAEAGLVVSFYGVGNVIAAGVGGWTADRFGRRNALALSMFSSAVTLLLLSQAESLPLIIVLTTLAGLTGEMYRPAAAALLTDLTPAGERIPAFALNRLAINLGFAAGPAVAGLLAERSFFLLFLGDALTSAAFGVIALTTLPEGVRVRRGEERRGEAVRTMLHDRAFVFFLVSSVLGAFVYFQSQTTFPLHVRASGLSDADYGLLISLNGLAIVLFELPLVAITQRFPYRPVLTVGSLLVGLGFALNAVANDLPELALTVLIWTLGEIIYAPVASAYVADIAPEHLRGRYQGAWGLTWGLAYVFAPAVGAAIFAWNADGLWLICGLLGLAAALLLLAARPPRVHPASAPHAAPVPQSSDLA